MWARNGTAKVEVGGWRDRWTTGCPILPARAQAFAHSLHDISMPVIVKTALLLIASNVFMTFAWYAHLKNLHNKPLYIAILVSWGIALFEYALQVPANRIGSTQLELGQLKIMQEVITLVVFVPFAALYMKEPVKLNYLWAALCMAGAVYFIFRR
jgi:uncharacterized protein (DUF486 family)